MSKRVLVTGGTGQLGLSLRKIAAEFPEFELIFVTRNELDLASKCSIEAFFSGNDTFDFIINTAAYTAVDLAETERELAEQINHLAVGHLARIAKEKRIFLLQVSTDYVFDGKAYRPYIESDAVAPKNHYGMTKLKGEQALQASGCAGAIVRTSWVYSEFGKNFVKTMLKLGSERDEISVVADQVGSPTYATDLARVCLLLIQTSAFKEGIALYHYSNEGVCSWYDFALAALEYSTTSCKVWPIATEEYPTAAQRPYYSVLDKKKIKNKTGFLNPSWRDSLRLCLRELE